MSARTVLYLHSSAGRYGADRQLALLATGLDRQRYRPVAVLAQHGPLADDLRAGGVEVHVRELAVLRRGLMSPAGLTGVVRSLAADRRALGRMIRERGVGLVHTNTSVTLGGAVAARAGRVPHVWHVREIYADFPRLWPFHRRLLRGADALVCVSEATRAPLGRGRVIHDGLATAPALPERAPSREALGLEPEGFVVAVAGRISSWKGQDVLARALAEPVLAATGAIGLVAGDAWPGEEAREAALRELAADLGLGQRLRMLGFRDDLDRVLAAADVVAVPSTRPDPLPNSALEAAAAGCCVVAAAHGGLPEIVRDGETGVLVTPGDPGALAAVLAELAADPARRERLGAAAAADVRARFAPERLTESIQALYDELLER